MSSMPSTILVHVDLFGGTGKWKYGFEVEITYHHGGEDHGMLLKEIDEKQTEVVKGTVTKAGYYVVITDDPEQRRNPTGRFFMNRLYTPDQIRRYCPNFEKETSA